MRRLCTVRSCLGGIVLWGAVLVLLAKAHSQEMQDLPAMPEKSTWCEGQVVDEGGNPVTDATVTATDINAGLPRSATTTGDGSFRILVGVAACRLEISAPGFVAARMDRPAAEGGTLDAGRVALRLEGGATEVVVRASREELAQEQVKMELTQRILGVIPNFMVTYDPKAVPLNTRQKYLLALRTMVDPEMIGVNLGWSALQQKTGSSGGYGNGPNGYARRFATSYGTSSIDTLLGSAVLPSIFRQDPRYFYKGSGSFEQRALYAISMSVISKSDRGHWQYNYSGLLGGLAAGGIANLYEPRTSRNGIGSMLENNAMGIGTSAISNLFQEFLVKKFVRH